MTNMNQVKRVNGGCGPRSRDRGDEEWAVHAIETLQINLDDGGARVWGKIDGLRLRGLAGGNFRVRLVCYAFEMVDVAVEGDRAVFRIEGLDKVWALRSQLDIPLAHIMAVDVNHDEVGRWWHGFKLLGTSMPGILAAGTFFYHSELVFWDVHDPAQTIIVSIEHEHYKKLIVEVGDPVATAAMLREAVGQLR